MPSQGAAVYRSLWRAVNTAFKGDAAAIGAAKQQIRLEFAEKRGVSDEAQLREALAAGREAAEFVRTCIVQGHETERGTVAMALEEHHDTGAWTTIQTPAEAEKAARSKAKVDDPDACYTG